MTERYLVIGGKPSVSGRMGRMLSNDCNRHHASGWYTFESAKAANIYADSLMKRHPRWTVAVIPMSSIIGPYSDEDKVAMLEGVTR